MKENDKLPEVFLVYRPSWALFEIQTLDKLLQKLLQRTIKTKVQTDRRKVILQISAVTNKMEYSKLQLDSLISARSKFKMKNIVGQIASKEEYDNHALCRCYLELLMVMLHGSISAMAKLVWLIYVLTELKERYINLITVQGAMERHHRNLNLTKILKQTVESSWYSYLHEIRVHLEHGDNIKIGYGADVMYLPDKPSDPDSSSVENKYEIVSWCQTLFNSTIDFHEQCSKELIKFLFAK